MKQHQILISATAIAAVLAGAAWATEPPTSGKAANGSPGWHFTQGVPDPVGRTIVDANGVVTVTDRVPGQAGPVGGDVPQCSHSTICTRKGGPSRTSTNRVVWDQTLGYTFSYPYMMPPVQNGGMPGGDPAAGVDSKGNVWILQRKPKGQPQLYKYDNAGKLLISVPAEVTGYQEKAHALTVDPFDNVWIADTNASTVEGFTPEGKLIKVIGVRDKRGDWDEAKGQHLLWQANAIAFAPNGDMYIGEGHANEGPNDVEGPDPANVIGAARVLHFDKDGKFLGQWFGDDAGPGKFDQVHGMAVDPKTGDVWLADREQYRFVIYSAEGKFVRTIQMRNLTCAIAFDAKGEPWMTSGQDGQVLKIDRDGKVLGAIGGGMGLEPGKFIEAASIAFDKAGNIYVGDTSVARIAKISPPKAKSPAKKKKA